MRRGGQPGRRVVGDHLVPGRQRLQRRRGRQVERERELHSFATGRAHAGRRHPQLPQRHPPVAAGQRVAGARPGEPLERRAARAGARREVLQRGEVAALVARGDERGDLVGAHAEHVAQADLDGGLVGGGRVRRIRHRAADLAGVDVRGEHRDTAPLRLVDERVGRVEAHRLLVEQRAEELRPVVHAQPRRLVGEQAEGGAVGLGEAEAREARDHREDRLGLLRRDVGMLGHRALDEALVVGLDRLGRALAAHRPAQALGLPHAEAGERLRDLEHLVLEDDRAERVAQRRLERRVQIGDLVRGVGAQPLAALDVRVDRAARRSAPGGRSPPGS